MKMNEWTKPRTIFAFMFYATYCYLIIMGKEIHEELITVVSTLLGYYYGQKVGKNATKDKANPPA